jgi:hypothetical protein
VTRPPPRARLLGGAGVVLALVLAAVVALGVAGGEEATTTKTYDTADGPVANPGRGWTDRIDTILDVRDFSESTADGVTLLHSYVRLDDYRDRDLPQDVLDRLAAGLDAVREAHLQIVLRFAYNAGPYPDSEPDATLAQMVRHVEQVAPVLQAHADVVAGIEAGFIGAWGEWHTSTHGLDQDLEAKRTLLGAERAAFPGQLMLRYPADLRALDAVDTGTPGRTVGDDTLDGSVGSHLDCFLSSVPDDNGTFGRDGSTPEADKELVAEAGRYAMVGGETCSSTPPPDRTTCPIALDELAQQHFTYLNRDFAEESLAALDDCRTEIGERLGYRLELRSATYPTELDATDRTLSLRFTIRNTGFASILAPRTAYAVLRCGREVQRVALDSDPRTWDPGADVEIGQELVFADPPGGRSCRLGLALPDSAAELADDPAYAVRLASSTSWVDGVNYVATVPVND